MRLHRVFPLTKRAGTRVPSAKGMRADPLPERDGTAVDQDVGSVDLGLRRVVVDVDPYEVPDIALRMTILVVIDARFVLDVVVVGKMNIFGADLTQMPVGSEGTALCVDQRVIIDLYKPEWRLCNRCKLFGSGVVILPGGAHANASGKESWIVGEEATGHEATVREAAHIDAVGVYGIGMRCDDLVNELFDGGTVNGLIIVGNGTRTYSDRKSVV